MRLPVLLSFAILAACADGPSYQDQQPPGLSQFGQQVNVPAMRPPLEPGKVFAGNAPAVLTQLRQLVARPDGETDAVIAELETYGLEKYSPMISIEYGRRLKIKGHPDWRYWFEVGSIRAKYDQLACNDRSAPQFVTVVMMEYDQMLSQKGDTTGYLAGVLANDDDRWRILRRILRRILNEGSAFNSKASAWWICSHGMSTVIAGMEGRTLTLADWWSGEETLKKERESAVALIDDMLNKEGF